jgi:hypothetical protein
MKPCNFFTLKTVALVLAFSVNTTNMFAQENDVKIDNIEDAGPSNFDPKYEKIKSRVSYVPGIKVVRGKTQVIVPEQESFCPSGSIFKFNNGDIQVFNRRSTDGGMTWNQIDHILENSTYQFPAPDNEVVMFQSENAAGGHSSAGRPEVSIQKTSQKGLFEAVLYRSKDHGRTRVKESAKIFLPEKLSDWNSVLCRKIVGLKDGSLLMSMYSYNKKGSAIEKMLRSIVLRSIDRGKSWYYLSTIAFDVREDVRGEGFNETSLLVLPDGKILSFMRSGASYQASLGSFNNNDWDTKMPFSYGKQTSIYLSISKDGGGSWSNVDPITSYGVWPDSVLMENGIVALTYGRPGNWIMFNDGKSESWGPIIPFYNGLYPPDCGNYISMDEIAPNILLVVYSRTNPNDHWKSEIVGTYFNVKPEVVE